MLVRRMQVSKIVLLLWWFRSRGVVDDLCVVVSSCDSRFRYCRWLMLLNGRRIVKSCPCCLNSHWDVRGGGEWMLIKLFT